MSATERRAVAARRATPRSSGRRPGSSAAASNVVVGRHQPLLERPGDGERLEGRARLVGEPGRHVARARSGSALAGVGRDRTPGQFAIARISRGARVHDDRRRAVGLVGLRRSRRAPRSVSAWRLASSVSFRSAPVGARVDRVALELVAERVADDLALAVGRRAARSSSEASSPVRPWLSIPTVPITWRGELALRVDAAAVGEQPDPGQVELAGPSRPSARSTLRAM